MAKDEQLSFRASTEVREAIERAAEADDRTASYVMLKAIEAWLKQKGWLKEPRK